MIEDYLHPADILLPKDHIEKWAVIACDQHTSDEEYWEDVDYIVGDNPSALRITLPEIYLKKDNSEKIRNINATMKKYLEDDVLEEHKNSMVYVERVANGKTYQGIVGCIDLACYDYHIGSRSLIRSTEETIIDRLPPRIAIRKDAPIEIPHIILLIDDKDEQVIEPLADATKELKKAYDFDLMKNGGHITGWFLDRDAQAMVNKSLGVLKNGDDLLFVVGDGNHSLAAAKECYEKGISSRYALVEVQNVHQKALEFESIYRVLFNVDEEDFLEKFLEFTEERGGGEEQTFEYYSKNKTGSMTVKSTAKLPIGTLQSFIDRYTNEHPEVEVDYIHGKSVVKKLASRSNTLGFIYEGLKKDDLFAAIVADGSLPRKTFSMNEADEKRFYIESRKIK